MATTSNLAMTDETALALLEGSDNEDELGTPRGGSASGSSSFAVKPYARGTGTEADQMRTEIVRLENVLSTRLASRTRTETSSTAIERTSKIEKYVEVMELTKCLRRQKEFLLNENRKRQRFAEKIQQAMPPSTDSIQFMKNVKYPPDEELTKIAQEAFREMREYDVSGKGVSYLEWETKRDSKSMYLHQFSSKSFVGANINTAFNTTWMYVHDEAKHSTLFRRHNKFCILKKLNDSMFLTRNIHQFVGESFPRHAMMLVFKVSIDQDNHAILAKSVMPPSNDAQHLVWTDECSMWLFTRRQDPAGGFDVTFRGRYGSTSAVAGNELPMLESYFFLIDWESLVMRPMFQFSST